MIPAPPTQTPRTMFSISDYNLTELKFEDANTSDSDSSSIIWVILFSILIILSILSNTVYIVSLSNKSITTTHILISCFFIVNLLDYSLMIFEFSLGSENQFTYPEFSCSFYQFFLQLTPLITSTLLLLLILHSFGVRYFLSKTNVMTSSIICVSIILMLLIPSLMFSEIAVYPSGARYCVIDMSSLGVMVGMDITSQHIITAIYAIIYRAVLAFWLPALIIIVPVINMFKMINTEEDKNLSISLSIAIAISYIVFNLPLATVTTVR